MSLISGEIIITNDFNSEYGVGDRVDLDFSIDVNDGISDYIITTLDCGGKDEVVDKRYYFSDGSKESFNIDLLLPFKGECKFDVEFDSDSQKSEMFEVNNLADIDYTLNDTYFSPGDSIRISGSVEKFNGDNYNGNLRVEIESVVTYINVDGGSFSDEVKIPNDLIKSGRYNLCLVVEELDDNDNKLVYGSVTDYFYIDSVASSIEIIGPGEIEPPGSLDYNVKLLDQSGDIIENETLIVDLVDSSDNKVFSEIVESGRNLSVSFYGNHSKGNSYLVGTYIDIQEDYSVYVNENKLLDISYEDGSIVFTNIGNSRYWDYIGFNISSNGSFIEEEIFVDLNPGDSMNWTSENSYNDVDVIFDDEIIEGVNLTRIGGMFIGFDLEIKENSYLIGFIIVFVVLVGIVIFYRKKFLFFVKVFKDRFSKIENSVFRGRSGGNIKEEKHEFLVMVINSYKSIDSYENKFSEKGFNLKKINSYKGYFLFNNKKKLNGRLEIFDFAKSLREEAKNKSDELGILINNLFSDRDIKKVKDFVLENLQIADKFPKRFVLGERVFPRNKLKKSIKKEKVDINGKEINVFVG